MVAVCVLGACPVDCDVLDEDCIEQAEKELQNSSVVNWSAPAGLAEMIDPLAECESWIL